MSALVIGVPVATVWSGRAAPRAEDTAAVADLPDVAAWVDSLDAAARRGLHGRTLTQALLGERVDVVAEHGDWAEIVLPDQPSSANSRGYPGWVRRAHLTSAIAGADVAQVVVTSPVGAAVTGSVRLSFGTRLPVRDSDSDRVAVGLPGAGNATLDPAHVAPYHVDGPIDLPGLLASATAFVGLRYLWGGTCAWGLDCSGLVHLVHRAHGRQVPRDAFDQHAAAVPVPLHDARPGDLYFFARPSERVYHVGLVTNEAGGEPTMLHAPEGDELVEDAPLAPRRRATLVAAGSFVRPQ